MFERGVDEQAIINCLQAKISNAHIQDKLTVIDPYFFKDGRGIFLSVIKPFIFQLREVEIITNQSYNTKQAGVLKKKLEENDIHLSIFHNASFHDRFWIVDERMAWVVGTSVNGFGNKHFFIQDDYLSSKDAETLLRLYRACD